jgi:oxygen-dependent protoporphyrinogen oxidase
MKRIAIVGGGIAGLTAAYELELARKRGADIDWQLYEAGNRLGGIVETTHSQGFILEGGPDAWVSEKPWARELAVELCLGSELIFSNDVTRKTYILIDGQLQPMPDRMRMMVPQDLSALEGSALFSDTARQAYANEPGRAKELRSEAPEEDESVASFIRRHFGEEVLTKIGAPLLSGVFGGDVGRLSVRAVMPNFVAMEREHGSLISGLQAKARGGRAAQPIFTTLRSGLGTLIDAIVAQLPPERVHRNRPALSFKRQGKLWLLRTSAFATEGRTSKKHFNHILLATPIDATRALLTPLDPEAAALIPTDASSAVLTALCWPAEAASSFSISQGFGFLVPQAHVTDEPQLLAATFVDQKFPDRAPAGARIIRVFFGGPSADTLAPQSDETIAAEALAQLTKILGPLPEPDASLTTIRRWPRSLPQYGVGHLERMAQLDQCVTKLGNLTLLGNGYRGVGLPDIVRDARNAARELSRAE